MADGRLIDNSDSELERQMLRAAADEKVPADVRRRALASLGLLAIAPLGTVSTAAASTKGATTAVKALGWHASLAKAGAIIGLGGALFGVGAAVVRPPANGEAPVAEAAPVSRRAAPKQPVKGASSRGTREATLSITSKGLSPWSLSESASSSYPRPPRADRPRAAPARAAAPSRNRPHREDNHAASSRGPEGALHVAATSIREEIDLLDRARTQLARGNGRAATEIIGHYFARYPNGELRAEAESVRREARLAGE